MKGDIRPDSIPEERLDNNIISIVSCTSVLRFVTRHAPTLAKQIVSVLVKRRGVLLFLNEYLNDNPR